MAERRPPDDEQLARRLRDLGARLDYPPTPDLARAVRERLVAAPAPRRLHLPRLLLAPRRLALVALLVAALAGAALTLSPATRSAVAEWLGLPGLNITYTTGTPTGVLATPAAARTPTAVATSGVRPAIGTPPATAATPGPFGQRLSLGGPTTLAAVQGQVTFVIAMPTMPALGPADEIYLANPPSDGQVSLVWRSRPDLPATGEPGVGLLLSQFRGSLAPGLWQKVVGPRTQIEYPRIGTDYGFWITGGPHEFSYADSGGQVRRETTRQIGGNVLLWERGGVTFRLEGARSLEEALRIAESLR